MIGLDFPLRKVKDPYEQPKEFRAKIGKNLKWAGQTAVLHQKLNVSSQLLIPLQFYTLENLKRLLDGLKGVPFDGVCMPLRHQTPRLTSEFLLEIHRRGIKVVHLLGSSSFRNITLAAWFATHCFDSVSFDSASWRLIAERGMGYLDPLDLHCHKLTINSPCTPVSNCICQICRHLSLVDILKTLSVDHTLGVKHIRSHNYYATGSVAQTLLDRTKFPRSLVKYLQSLPIRKGYPELIETIKWLDAQFLSAPLPLPVLKAA